MNLRESECKSTCTLNLHYVHVCKLQVAIEDKLCSYVMLLLMMIMMTTEIFRMMMITSIDNDDDKAGKELRGEKKEEMKL